MKLNMKPSISATHLLRVFALFALVVLFLLTLTRAGFSLWQLNHLESVEGFDQLQGFAELFITGWRFDLALIGAILLIPVTLGTFLAMLGPLRVLAKIIILVFLIGGMFVIILSEYVTPYFLYASDSRPDMAAIQGIENPLEVIAGLWSTQMIPAIIGLVLSILLMIAFIARLETSRLLRFRIAPRSGITLMIVGGALCIFAMISNINFIQEPTQILRPLNPSMAEISTDTLVNELSLNTAYEAGWSLVAVLPAE